MVAFKCKDIGMDCKFETNAANVQELENKIAAHAKIASIDKAMGMKIHKAEK